MTVYLGFDIGGTKSAVVLGDSGGTILEKEAVPTDLSVKPENFMETLCTLAAGLLSRRQGCTPAAAGISCGGPLDSRRGIILSPPNLPGWDRVPAAELISRRFGLPARLLNDADASALAEGRFGAGRGMDNLIFLTFGTGMGAGLILNGRLYTGASGIAGEIGHVRMEQDGPRGHGKAGSFEGFCSGGGIAGAAAARVKDLIARGTPPAWCPGPEALAAITAKKVAAAARKGDREALAIFRQSGEYLGKGLAIMIDLLNPEAIIIGSIYTRAEDLLKPAVMEVLHRECLPAALAACQILPARLGEAIGDMAALSAAMEGEVPV